MSEKPPETTSAAPSSSASKGRGKLLRNLGIAAAAGAVLLVIVYFVATSSAFITGVILPRVGPVIGAEVTAGSVSLSPFSSVEVRDLKLKTTGDELLLETASLRARFSLMDILGGTITVSSVEVDSPTIRLIRQPDGKSNLDPILAALAAQPPKPESAPPKLNLGPITVKNANLRFTQHDAVGGRTVAETKGLNATVDGLKNNQPLKAEIEGTLAAALTGAQKNDTLSATLKGTVQTELGDDPMPKQVKTALTVTVGEATGAFADAAQLGAALNTDLTLQDIKQLSIDFTKGGAALGRIAASGPLDLLKQEGKLKIEVSGIGNEVLSLVGAKYGILFGGTKLAANYDVELKDQARIVHTTGTVTGEKFSLRRGELATPTLDLRLNYDVAIDLVKSNAVIRAFSFNATQSGRALLTATLSKEMLVDWGRGADALDESALELAVNQLNLADWRTFLGTNVTAGSVNGKLALAVRKAGQDIALDLDARLNGLAGQFGENKLDRADVVLAAKGQVAELSRVSLSSFSAQLAQAKQPVASVNGSGSFDSATFDAQFQSVAEANLAALSRLLDNPAIKLTSGTLKFDGRLSQKNLAPGVTHTPPKMDQSVAGAVRLEGLTGEAMGSKFDRFEQVVDLDVELKDSVATIRKATGTLRQAGQPGGTFEAAGQVNLAQFSGQMDLKLVDLNQHTLRSFTAALAPNELKTASIGATATARFDAKSGAVVTGDLSVANLLITDPAGQLPQTPLAMKATLDATASPTGVVELRKINGGISVGGANGGGFEASGRFDPAKEAAQFALKLADLNQNALRPFLAATLGETTLASVSINADSTGSYDARGASSVKGSLQVVNLLLTNPKANLPKEPLAVSASLDAAMAKQVLDLRQAQLKLSPTARAKNEVNVSGKLDFSKPAALAGQFKVAADSLDVTPYFDMFNAPQPAAAPARGKAQPQPKTPPAAAPAPEKEPDAIKLPVQLVTADVNIGKFFLREIALDSLAVGTKVETTTVDVNPFKVTFNGAPVAGQIHLNLGVPGYQYDLRGNVNRLPIAPIVDTFVSDMAGKAKGDLIFDARIKGAGVTGENLRRLLTGNVALTLTNATVKLPDPDEVLGGGMGALVKLASSIMGLVAPVLKVGVRDLIEPPVTWVDGKIELGNGQADMKHFIAASEAFRVNVPGKVSLADVLTNSPIHDIPVELSLSKTNAMKAKLAKEDSPLDGGYVKLPDFVNVGGTVGEPKVKIDELVIVGLVARSVGGGAGAAVGDAADLIKGVGGLFKGKKKEEAPPATKDGKTTETKPKEPSKGGLFNNPFKKKE